MMSQRVNDGIERTPEQYFRRYNAVYPEREVRKGFRKPDSHSAKRAVAELRKRWEVKHNEHMRKHGFERGFIDCRTLKEQGIERRPEVHLGFEAAGRLDDAQRHDIMQKRSEPDYSRHLEQARTVGYDIREWLDTPVKQHELVRRLQHDVAREHGFDMRDRVSRQNRTEPERVKSPSRGFSMGF